jgi:hypothetical protein
MMEGQNEWKEERDINKIWNKISWTKLHRLPNCEVVNVSSILSDYEEMITIIFNNSKEGTKENGSRSSIWPALIISYKKSLAINLRIEIPPQLRFHHHWDSIIIDICELKLTL